jgi:ketosteroid isomerase-like protein
MHLHASELLVAYKGDPDCGTYVYIEGNVARSTGLTNTNGKAKNGTSVNSPTFESDVLKKDSDGEWKLESHSAWRVSQ